MKYAFLFLLITFLSINFISAGDLYSDCSVYGNCKKISPSGGLTINQINSSINGSYWTVGLDQNVAGGTKTGSYIINTTNYIRTNGYYPSKTNPTRLYLGTESTDTSLGILNFEGMTTNEFEFYPQSPYVTMKADLGDIDYTWRDLWLDRDAHIGKVLINGSSGRINATNITTTNIFTNNICYSNGTNCVSSNINGTNINVLTINSTSQTINGNLNVKGNTTLNGTVNTIGGLNLKGSDGTTQLIFSNSTYTSFGTSSDSGLSQYGYKYIFSGGASYWSGTMYVPSPYRIFVSEIGSNSAGTNLIIDSNAGKDIIFKNDNALNTTLIIKNTKIIANRSLEVVGNLNVTGNITAHYKSSDGTVGVTVSGTTCTITAIKDGIITGASCV